MRLIRLLVVPVGTLVACAPSPEPRPSIGAPPPVASEHPHELHLPPVGPQVHVTFDGKSVDVPVATLPHAGTLAPLITLWKAAWPAEDPSSLHFDLTGSDGFHPSSRPPCARWLSGAELAAARIDVVTHDVSFDDSVTLPGCYRVKAVVALEGAR